VPEQAKAPDMYRRRERHH